MDDDWETDLDATPVPPKTLSEMPAFLENHTSQQEETDFRFDEPGNIDPFSGHDGFGGGSITFDKIQCGQRQGWGQGMGRGQGGGRGGGCFKCGKEGHLSRNCMKGCGEARDDPAQAPVQVAGFGFGEPDNCDPFSACDDNQTTFRFGGGSDTFGDLDRGRGRGRGRGQGRGRGRGSGQGGGRGGNCFKCGDGGHISRNCTKEGGRASADSFGRGGFSAGGFGMSNGNSTDVQEPERPPPIFYPKEIDDCELFNLGVKTGVNFESYDKIPVKVTGEGPLPEPVAVFNDMNLRQVLLQNLLQAEFPRPTPIQKHAIPILMSGRDIMACAQTGSGKTAAFLLPMLNYILENDIESHSYENAAQPVGLVLAPTRELALQIFQESRKFSLNTVAKSCVCYGGVATNFQLRRLKEQGCHILIATPGRLSQFLSMGKISFRSLKFLVFDEADRMLDMGFIDDMEKLIANPDMPPKEERQTMMFSATFPSEVQQCALRFMNNYLFLVAGQVGAANKDVEQLILEIPKFQKREKLLEYIRAFEESKEKVLVFVEMKRQADFVGTFLSTNGIQSVTLHGGRYQEQREEALSAFRSSKYMVLVATSVASRGLDIRGVGFVLNYDMPKTADEYVHRIGRTGRVGNPGKAVSFYDPESDHILAKDLVRILSEAEQEVPAWLRTAAQGGGLHATYMGSGQFASTDIRDLSDGMNDVGGLMHFGGPSPEALQPTGPGGDDEDMWDE